MSAEELRELDTWIFTQVFGYTSHYIGETTDKRAIFERVWLPPDTTPDAPYQQIQERCKVYTPEYTADPAAAMALLKKCATMGQYGVPAVMVWQEGEKWFCNWTTGGSKCCSAETLELAICLFAKKLFEKGKR